MPELVYLNFDLEIEKADGGYRAHVLSSPAGEARAQLGPVDHLPADAAPQVMGGALFDAVFSGDVLGCLRRSLDSAQRSDRGLRIRLRLSETPELAGLPWELMYDGQRATFLGLSRETPLVRYLDLPEPAEPGTPEIRLRVLAVFSSPSDYPPLDADQEWTNLKQGMADLEGRGVVTVDRLDPPTVDNLQRQLLKQEYHILHFLGHGDYSEDDQDSVLLLTAADGKGDAVSGETFTTLLRDQRSLRLAVISACRGAVSGVQDPYSGVAQRLVRGGVPAVIAMRSAISAAAAEALARSFYTALAAGAAVDEAMAEARKTLYSGGFPSEWATAVLYMRAADGHLWRPDPAIRQKRIRLALGAAAAVVAVALLGFFIWWRAGPTQMDSTNTLNVAVLDPGLQGNDGKFAAAPNAALVRSWMVAQLGARGDPVTSTERVGVWYNGLPRSQKRDPLPVLQKSTDGEREAEARVLADRIQANVVISARITREPGQSQDKFELAPEFFVFPRLAATAGEAIGYYTLGQPIAFVGDLAQDSAGREAVRREVTRRMEIMNTIVLALQYDAIGDHARALTVLQALEAKLGLATAAAPSQPVSQDGAVQRAPAGSGIDDVYYFLAREKLFLHQSQAAADDANRALQIDQNNVRARIVLAGALLDLAIAADPLTSLEPGGLQEQAENQYELAVTQAAKASDDAAAQGATASPQLPIARLGQGDALVAHAETLCYLYGQSPLEQTSADAQRVLDQADRALDPSILDTLQRGNLWRMVAQYHAIAGAARLCGGRLAAGAGNLERARQLFEQARTEFEACKLPLAKTPDDETLRVDIIDGGCTPAIDQVEQELARLG